MANLFSRRKLVHQFKETGRTDPNRSQCKRAGILRCPTCSSVSVRGRWISARAAKVSKPPILVTGDLKCPACTQLDQRFALGVIELRGDRWKENEELVFRTIQNAEKIARVRNDQHRILWTRDFRGVTRIYVTLPELARRIGRELEKSFQGVAEYERSSEEPYLRVRWWSDLPSVGHRPGAALGVKRKSKVSAGEALDSTTASRRSKSFRGRSKRK